MFNIDLKSDKVRLFAAFTAVYLIWGSTYLAIRFGLECLPPFLMSGARYLIAGAVLYLYATRNGVKHPTAGQWFRASIIGVLLFVLGNGGVVIAAATIPSGLVSLMVAAMPIYVVLMQWLRPGGIVPGRFTVAGLMVGVIGMALLLGPGHGSSSAPIDYVGVLWVTLASLGWAAGSLYARSAKLPESQLQSAGMQTASGGAIMLLISLALGEHNGFQIAEVSTKSWLAFVYLIVFGSIVAFTAYLYMIKNAAPTRVSSYAYVNPVVAVFLGWALAGEAVTGQTIIASAVILCAVWLITRPKKIQFADGQNSTSKESRRIKVGDPSTVNC